MFKYLTFEGVDEKNTKESIIQEKAIIKGKNKEEK